MERALETAQARVLAPAGLGIQMTEARASLAHDEAGAVAVAVEVDADQLLGGTAGLALDPKPA
jgi:hypothetical protein